MVAADLKNENEKVFFHPEQHHEGKSTKPRRLVLALEHCDHSGYVVNYAIEKLLNPATDYVVVANVQPLNYPFAVYGQLRPSDGVYLERFNALDDSRRCEAQKYVQSVLHKLHTAGIECAGIVMKGDARAEITRLVEQENSEFLVVGSKSISNIERLLMGSVSSYLVNHCPCTVVVVKPPKNQ